MDIKETGWVCVDWIGLAQDKSRCAGCCGQGDEFSVSIKFREFFD
jgi:hypothetical protein